MPSQQYTAPSLFIRLMFAAVWLANGLFCKVLTLVPRHESIVARIMGSQYAPPLTTIIGILEIFMAAWVLTGYKPRFCAAVQMAAVASMNIIEFCLAPDLLLFGRLNLVVALVFIAVLYLAYFQLTRQPLPHRSKHPVA